MTLTCAVTRFAAPTSTGSQNITTADLGGLTPKAVLLIGTTGITDGTAAAHTTLSIGAATGSTNEWVVQTNSADALDTTDTHAEAASDGCILYTTPGTGTDTAKADFTEFIADGCTLNWSVVDAAFLITAVFFAGSDLSAHANNAALGNSTNNTVDVTDPGFEPDLVIGSISNGLQMPEDSTPTKHSIGFVSNDGAGGVVQRCIVSVFRSGQGTSANAEWSRDDCIVAGINSNGTADWRGSLGTFDDNGFTVTTLTAGSNNTTLGYLALNFGGAASSWVGTHTPSDSNGENAETGPGFKPQIVLRLMTQVGTVNTGDTSGDQAGTHGFSAMDADDEFSASVSDEDGAGTSNSQSLSDDTSIQIPDDDGTAGLTASFVSFDSLGWTDNYSRAGAGNELMPALAIEEFAVAAVNRNIAVISSRPPLLL